MNFESAQLVNERTTEHVFVILVFIDGCYEMAPLIEIKT